MEPSSTPPVPPPPPSALPGADAVPADIVSPSREPKLAPQKYIRTFEGDMEALKKGWTPNLTPLKESPPPAPTTFAPAPAEPPVHHIPPVPSKPASAAPAPPPPTPAPSVPQAPPEELSLQWKPSPLQTYANAFSQRIKETKASTTSILAAEEDARRGAPVLPPPAPSHGALISIIAGVLLLVVGGAGAYIAYSRYVNKTAPVIVAPTASAPIFVDEREKISGESPAATLQAITESLTHTLPLGAVRLLYTDLATTTGGSVFAALGLPAPGILLRNINAAQSMAGVINVSGVQTPFFILSVASYGDTFAGMLTWETTMPRDLDDLFPTYAPPATSTSSPQTTATTASGPLFSVFFHDEIVSNHDVRIYRDAAGRSILVYGYWNQKTLVIARDPATFEEILGRLATSRTPN